jgi:DNA-directed RNA polymerase subunit N (RpoN/RPB10)
MTQQQLLDTFEYRDGELYWKKDIYRKIKKGMKAGTIKNDTGYVIICVKRTLYRAHRLIWTMFNGEIPEGKLLDHIDRNRSNNRIENLRLVTISENARNSKRYVTNTTGVRGVYYDKGMKKYCARIYKAPYEVVILGYSESLEEAARMRREAELVNGYL